MRKLFPSFLALAAAASIHAAPITFQDIHDPSDKFLTAGTQNASYTFEHNILDNGFSPSGHTILDADLTISLADDGDADSWLIFALNPEYGTVTADGSLLGSNFEVDNDAYHFNVNTAFLQADGKLLVTVTAVSGDFTFKSSTLDVTANANPAAVPEPGSMALLGLGLAGLGSAAWRRRKQA